MGRSLKRKTNPNKNPESRLTPFQKNNVNGNLNAPEDWDGNCWYKNTFSASRGFEGPWGQYYNNYDSSGWPLDSNWRLVLSTGPTFLPLNTWQRCSCQGTLGSVFPLATSNDCQITNITLLSDGITWEFDFRYTGVTVIIKGNPNSIGGVRNIIIPAIDYNLSNVNEGSIFNDATLLFYRQFSGFRIMNYLGVCFGSNWDTTPGIWANRITTQNRVAGYSMSTPAGIFRYYPIERAIELVNTAKAMPGSNIKSLWVAIHHAANEEYVTNWLNLIASTLHPDITVYIELSNETWNYGYAQASYYYTLSQDAQWIQTANLHYDGVTDPNVARSRIKTYLSWYFKQISDSIWPNYNRAPIRWVNAGQLASPGYYLDNLNYITRITNLPANNIFYGIAVAPYAFPDWNILTHKNDANLVLESLKAGIDFMAEWDYSIDFIQSGEKYAKEVAVQHNIEYIEYEGGYDMTEFSTAWLPTMQLCFTDPKIEDLTYYFLKQKTNVGITYMNWFQTSPGWYNFNSRFATFNITDFFQKDSYILKGLRKWGKNCLDDPASVDAHNYFPSQIGQSANLYFWNNVEKTQNGAGVIYKPETYVANTQFSGSGLFGPYYKFGQGDCIYGNILPGEFKSIHICFYVPSSGEYEISNLLGYSQKNYLYYMKDVPRTVANTVVSWSTTTQKSPILADANNYTSVIYDAIKAGRTKIEFYHREFGSSTKTLVATFDPPPLGSQPSPDISRTSGQVAYFNEGWHMFEVRIHVYDYVHSISGNITGFSIANNGIGYTNPVVTIPLPDISGGVQATAIAQFNVNANGNLSDNIGHISITNCGSGYTSNTAGFTSIVMNPQWTQNVVPITISDPTGYGFVGWAFVSSMDNGLAQTFVTDVFGDKVYDANGNLIVLTSEAMKGQYGVNQYTVTKIS